MFSDFNSEVTGFEPSPETERLVNDKSSQTSDLKTSNQKTQTSSTRSAAIEAIPDDALGVAQSHSYDAEKLSKFLKRILPHLEKELNNSECSSGDLEFNHEYNGIEGFSGEGQRECAQPQTRKIIQPDFCKEKIISSLSWNSSSVLGLACSEKSHTGWCNHETIIGLYNTGKAHFDKDPPMEALKVSGCVRCIQFHNRIPSLLAGGLYHGEVIVWDLKHDKPTQLNKKESGYEDAHVDVITCLKWRENENGLWLISAGRDGRIILWKVTLANIAYEVHQRFLMLKQHLNSKLAAGLSEHLEVVHLDFRSSESPQFVAACGGGTLFLCSMTTARALTASPRYRDPVLRNYKSRRGINTRVSCHLDLFASCGTDSEIHIFNYDQPTPIMKIHTNYDMLLGVVWISPKELLTWGDSRITLQGMRQSSEGNVICDVEGGVSAIALKITSNGHNRKLAIGTRDGGALILSDWPSAS